VKNRQHPAFSRDGSIRDQSRERMERTQSDPLEVYGSIFPWRYCRERSSAYRRVRTRNARFETSRIDRYRDTAYHPWSGVSISGNRLREPELHMRERPTIIPGAPEEFCIVINRYGSFGAAFAETDLHRANLEATIDLISG
jgi:hypothetical protein